MHILKLPSWYIPHGGKFVCNQAQVLNEKGLDVRVLANVSLAITEDKANYFTLPCKAFLSEEDDLQVFRHYVRDVPKLRKLNAKRWIASTVQLFEKYQKEFGNPDLIHAHSALWGGYAAYEIKKKYNIPYVITEHFSYLSLSCDYAKKQLKDWYTPYYEKSYSHADYIMPVSNQQIPKIKTFLTKEVPIKPITNVINTDFFFFKERVNGNTKKIQFVSVNGFYFYKGYDILIPAFDAACHENPNIYITIVGENFEQSEFQNTWWKQVKNKEKFRFTGKLTAEGVRAELWNADCYIIPSRSEGQPQATLEALCTGLPMVCTNVIPNNVATPENAIMVPVENIELMTEAILQLSDTYRNYDNKIISENAIAICSKDAFAQAIMEVYNNVAANNLKK
ncbi:MAG: glycosyltransferase [Bacteroidetes bacterium]|nr:glycosyltransferase [Bacteroidota bacterium]